ncbi:hypothetical protein TI10_17915 [Photorhabdus luminescens subsp. luminescens]|uniref:Uncharacterized protein n=2 Tax=Photorhabdus luminescens TaxID=29488 RepID=A0A1G5QSZ4_PHOLU|nr:hypothetical protein [Photorhabdus luminescens]KMW71979.1 hypothetical protein TI10_17915 [Photorhabdus luminescens subsp. luminescens]OWO82925.1 hypothetical protein B5C26_07950 [Photorhabdus luminescens]TDB44138.1 hypothetical protein C5468_22825 [Photorhabdus luminescens subsp. mexicana]SCZ64975.1 hypothetical protein SAMN02982990_02320 [Photorhabdus luminescens]
MYNSDLGISLYEAIREKAAKECSESLLNLIPSACDINEEVHSALAAHDEKKNIDVVNNPELTKKFSNIYSKEW